MNRSDLSPALTFLFAALDALPKSMGPGERTRALDSAMTLAIDARMKFDRYDGDTLKERQFRVESCVGVHRPLTPQWYSRACAKGSSYAAMWEASEGMLPWKASEVLLRDERDRLKNSRVAIGLGILLPFEAGEAPSLQSMKDGQVWWCTDIDQDRIKFCRYRMPTCIVPQQPEGRPARHLAFTRAEWEALQASLGETAQAA